MGPVATQMLGDYGADVIKIERAGAGDLSRTLDSRTIRAGLDNPIFCSPQPQQALDRARPAQDADRWPRCCDLIDDADVVVNNFRAGVMERMGFGYEDAVEAQPAASSTRSAPASA